MSLLVVSGTGTDVGKTVATAALASAAAASRRVAVVKPAQTGMEPDEPGDLAEVTRLSGVADTYEFARFPDALSPHHAAVIAQLPPLGMLETVRRIAAIENSTDLVLIEGSGGLLVPFDDERPWTIVDLALELDAPIMLVTTPGLGTINHTALSVEYLAARRADLAGIIIGSWPEEPDLAMRCSLVDLARMAPTGELAGVLPSGMPAMGDFAEQARAALAPQWGGTFQWRDFLAASA